MKRTGRKKEWSIALFGFSLLAFFPPILTIFDKPILISGIPLPYLYLFGVWLCVIIAMAVGARRRDAPLDSAASSKTLENDLDLKGPPSELRPPGDT